jgi:hypothetical protein
VSALNRIKNWTFGFFAAMWTAWWANKADINGSNGKSLKRPAGVVSFDMASDSTRNKRARHIRDNWDETVDKFRSRTVQEFKISPDEVDRIIFSRPLNPVVFSFILFIFIYFGIF